MNPHLDPEPQLFYRLFTIGNRTTFPDTNLPLPCCREVFHPLCVPPGGSTSWSSGVPSTGSPSLARQSPSSSSQAPTSLSDWPWSTTARLCLLLEARFQVCTSLWVALTVGACPCLCCYLFSSVCLWIHMHVPFPLLSLLQALCLSSFVSAFLSVGLLIFVCRFLLACVWLHLFCVWMQACVFV